MQTLLPMTTSAKLSIQTFSPIHTWLPIFKRQGYFMFTIGLILTPLPTLQPKRRSNNTFSELSGFNGFKKNKTLVKYHKVLTSKFRPTLYSELSYLESCVFNF